MAKTILTPKQLEFLEFVQNEPQITKRFYLTDGTALAEFYLRHRLSEDIDLFTESSEVNQQLVTAFLKKTSPILSIAKIKIIQFLGLVSYKLIYKDKEELKVDFNYYPFPRIERGTKFKNLQVDSLYDITVNKIHTLFMKPRTRDYIDLYFSINKFNLNIDKLILDAKAKFDWDIDRINLASQFLRVKDIKNTELPKILIPFNTKDMEDFFLQEAKKLGKKIFK